MTHFPTLRKFLLSYCEFVNSRIPAVTAPLQDSRLRTLAQSLTLLVALASGVALWFLTPRMAPIQPGYAVKFWQAAGVRLEVKNDDDWGGNNAYFIDDEWAAYEIGHWHGSELYSVPLKEVMPYFDKVVELLREDH